MEENFKEKYFEYQMLVQQLQQLQQNSNALDKHINDLVILQNNLGTISETKKDNETLIPLGSGIFLKGELKENSKVIMNVGSNVAVEKSVDDAQNTVASQLKEVSNVLDQIKEEINNTTESLKLLEKEFEETREESLRE